MRASVKYNLAERQPYSGRNSKAMARKAAGYCQSGDFADTVNHGNLISAYIVPPCPCADHLYILEYREVFDNAAAYARRCQRICDIPALVGYISFDAAVSAKYKGAMLRLMSIEVAFRRALSGTYQAPSRLQTPRSSLFLSGGQFLQYLQ